MYVPNNAHGKKEAWFLKPKLVIKYFDKTKQYLKLSLQSLNFKLIFNFTSYYWLAFCLTSNLMNYFNTRYLKVECNGL